MKIHKRFNAWLALCLLTVCMAFSAYAQDDPADAVEPMSEAELQQMLAPIALYPDTVLAHILIAATYPLEVVQAQRWVEQNSNLEGEQALQAVENEDWDPSVKALVPFPQILKNMSDDLDWTQALGEAFLADEVAVMDAVQALRQHAYDEGNLESLDHLEVKQEEEKIIIEPRVREVVYIPYYDARYVYGDWWWYNYPPVYWHYPSVHYHASYPHRIYWGPRVHVTFGFFFSSFQWHHHRLVVIDHHHHHYRNRVYYGYQVAHHNDARHWRHNSQHRRGVAYRNPRTRDYFEKRSNTQGVVTRQQQRSPLNRSSVTTTQDRREWSERKRETFSVQNRTANGNVTSRDLRTQNRNDSNRVSNRAKNESNDSNSRVQNQREKSPRINPRVGDTRKNAVIQRAPNDVQTSAAARQRGSENERFSRDSGNSREDANNSLNRSTPTQRAPETPSQNKSVVRPHPGTNNSAGSSRSRSDNSGSVNRSRGQANQPSSSGRSESKQPSSRGERKEDKRAWR